MWNNLLLLLFVSSPSRFITFVEPFPESRPSQLPPPRPLAPLPRHRTFALFKPDGYLSQFVNNGQIKKRQRMLGELFDPAPTPPYPPGLMPIGRLDEMSEGLLLVTTDGALSHRVNTGGVDKEYYCQLDGALTEGARRELEAGGVEISVKSGGGGEPWMTRPCRAAVLGDAEVARLPPRGKAVRDGHRPTTWLSVTVREGRNRQVRRMTAAVGYPTLRLVRVRVGCVRLLGGGETAERETPRREQMQPGEIRELSGDELSALDALIDACQASAPGDRQE